MVSRGRSDRGKKRIPFLLRGLFVPIHRSSAEGAKVVFPFTEAPPPPSVRRPVNTPVLRPRSGNHSSGIRHSIFNFVPPYTKSRHSREIPRYFSLFDLLSTGLPHSRAHSAYLPARVLLLEYEFTASPSPLFYEGSRLSENLLPTAIQPCVIPTTLPPSSNPPSPLIPYTDLSYTRAPRLQWSRTFHPFSRLPPGHAPFFSILRAFQSFTVFSPCCFPPAGFIRLNSRLAFCYRWLDWMVASARRTHQ